MIAYLEGTLLKKETDRIIHHKNLENAIAYDVNHIKAMIARAGQSLSGPIRFGSWSGSENPIVGGQDMEVTEKPCQ